MVPPQNLESFILDLDQALAWLGAQGIEYRKILDTVREHRMAGTLDELRTIVPAEQYRIAFIESTDLIAIAKNFGRIRGPCFREKIRVAITGPVHPLDENKSGLKARDFLFELGVAAFFRNRNLPVLTHTDKDLITRVSGHTLLVECKRPQSKNGVRRSIEKATDQLRKHFNNDNRGDMLRGLIALDISIVMNPQKMYVNARSALTCHDPSFPFETRSKGHLHSTSLAHKGTQNSLSEHEKWPSYAKARPLFQETHE
jgi:hypothetical protein